ADRVNGAGSASNGATGHTAGRRVTGHGGGRSTGMGDSGGAGRCTGKGDSSTGTGMGSSTGMGGGAISTGINLVLEPGDRVTHERFGEGEVISVEGESPN
ncbi:MAG: hypothetical protein GT599_11175, partial [Bacteroidales bacterium]|nr:hypothetical protein [Bacteroidales bacterium]